jgi:hypothetical protein
MASTDAGQKEERHVDSHSCSAWFLRQPDYDVGGFITAAVNTDVKVGWLQLNIEQEGVESEGF